ncbi:hypothetical protein GJ744_004465 [Endocarpon pusillum]|uniref:Uncharacterized protein n=1 Tax=Endocarpon pusillum TaxID=364733 RepID=A0A8H7ARI1_9EURO|nr:hypothetical protein GJ744_004465 [Endocarpon pusillum]
MKRKALDSLSPQRPQSHPITNHTPAAAWNSPASDSSNNLNSRTRKRLRDGRPDEETIHQNTLSKLYAAQQRNEQSDAQQDHSIPFTPSPTPSRGSTTSATNTIPHHKEKAQASLHAFFGGGHNQSVPQIPGPDPQSSHATTLPSVTTATPQCEDCSAPLLQLSSYPNDVTTVAGDTEMMDIDAAAVGFGISSSSDEGSAYSCVSCGRRVCDTCAVRGDWRVCLECANPGNGNRRSQGYGSGYGYSSGSGGSCGAEAGNMPAQGAGASRMGDKRWVGGIGWL